MRYVLIAAVLGAAILYAHAQSGGARVVSACGTLGQTYAVGSTRQVTVDTNGVLC